MGDAGGAGRRAILCGAAGIVLSTAGCAHTGSPGAPGTAATSSGGLPATPAWRPDPADLDPEVKLRAVRLVQALGGWPPGGGGAAPARDRVAALGLPASLAGQAGALRPAADQAALEVICAQYGGLLADSASVLVVCRQWTCTPGGPVHAGGTTVDVRLSRARPRWTVTALRPGSPGPAARPPSAAARAVLADPRIRLPPAAEADVRGGAVHPSALRALLRLAGGYRMDISVVRSGHPLQVFGTRRPSDHPFGRAFDVWRINDRAVVDRTTPRDLVEAFMRDAAAAGSYNVGGPVRPAGGATANQFFSDDTHHDHVHVGFAE